MCHVCHCLPNGVEKYRANRSLLLSKLLWSLSRAAVSPNLLGYKIHKQSMLTYTSCIYCVACSPSRPFGVCSLHNVRLGLCFDFVCKQELRHLDCDSILAAASDGGQFNAHTLSHAHAHTYSLALHAHTDAHTCARSHASIEWRTASESVVALPCFSC